LSSALGCGRQASRAWVARHAQLTPICPFARSSRSCSRLRAVRRSARLGACLVAGAADVLFSARDASGQLRHHRDLWSWHERCWIRPASTQASTKPLSHLQYRSPASLRRPTGQVAAIGDLLTLAGFFDGDNRRTVAAQLHHGAFQVYNVAPNSINLHSSAFAGAVGLNWQFSCTGNFQQPSAKTDQALAATQERRTPGVRLKTNQITTVSALWGSSALIGRSLGIGIFTAPRHDVASARRQYSG